MKFKNQMVGWTLFSAMLSLFTMAYAGMQDAYSFASTDVDASGNDVATAITELNLIEGMNGFAQGLFQVVNPGDFQDILGGLLAIMIGAIQTLTGIVTTPLEVLDVLMGFYYIPNVIYVLIGTIFLIYAGFTVLEAKTGRRP